MNKMHRENQEKWQQQLTKHMAGTKQRNTAQEEKIAELEVSADVLPNTSHGVMS